MATDIAQTVKHFLTDFQSHTYNFKTMLPYDKFLCSLTVGIPAFSAAMLFLEIFAGSYSHSTCYKEEGLNITDKELEYVVDYCRVYGVAEPDSNEMLDGNFTSTESKTFHLYVDALPYVFLLQSAIMSLIFLFWNFNAPHHIVNDLNIIATDLKGVFTEINSNIDRTRCTTSDATEMAIYMGNGGGWENRVKNSFLHRTGKGPMFTTENLIDKRQWSSCTYALKSVACRNGLYLLSTISAITYVKVILIRLDIFHIHDICTVDVLAHGFITVKCTHLYSNLYVIMFYSNLGLSCCFPIALGILRLIMYTVKYWKRIMKPGVGLKYSLDKLPFIERSPKNRKAYYSPFPSDLDLLLDLFDFNIESFSEYEFLKTLKELEAKKQQENGIHETKL